MAAVRVFYMRVMNDEMLRPFFEDIDLARLKNKLVSAACGCEKQPAVCNVLLCECLVVVSNSQQYRRCCYASCLAVKLLSQLVEQLNIQQFSNPNTPQS